VKYYVPVSLGSSAGPEADLNRADELNSRALALDPNMAGAHLSKANILNLQGRLDEAMLKANALSLWTRLRTTPRLT